MNPTVNGLSWKALSAGVSLLALVVGIIVAGAAFAVADSNRLAMHTSKNCHDGAANELEDHEDRLDLIERRLDVLDVRQQIILENVKGIRTNQKEGFAKLEMLIKENRP